MATLATPATVPAESVVDLNLMVRQGRYEPQMRRLVIERRGTFLPTANVTALLCRTSGLQLSHEQGTDTLEQDDVFLVSGGASHPLQLTHAGTATLYAVELFSAMRGGQAADDVDTIVGVGSTPTTAI